MTLQKKVVPEIRGSFRSFPAAEQYFRNKVNLPTQRWDDLKQGQHARAFVVAGATRDALLTDLREAVDAAISKGETLEDFRARFRDIVQKNGWTNWTGEGTKAGFNWRTSVIYHTNMRTAYMAGRWETLKTFPYLRYQHNAVLHPRLDHLSWNGLIIATVDPWWETHYPPNGWGCRCSATGVSQQLLKAMGKRGPDPTPAPSKGDPPPEWAYNVGEADSGAHVADAALAKNLSETWEALPAKPFQEYARPAKLPTDVSTVQLLPDIRDPSDIRAAWHSLYGDQVALADPSGAQVLLDQGVVDHWLEDPKRLDGRQRYLPLLRDVVEHPFEIWANFARNLLGQISLRRYYVKRVEVEEDGKKTTLTMIAEVLPGGVWGAFDFFRGERPQSSVRSGLLVWARAL